MLQRACSVVLAAAVTVQLAAGRLATGQCADFAPEFAPSGVLGSVDRMRVFDDGSGAQLYAAGRFSAAASSCTRPM